MINVFFTFDYRMFDGLEVGRILSDLKEYIENPEVTLIMGGQEGVVKIIAGGKHREILGVHILGCRATDLIGEGALAIGLEATTEEIIAAIHAHPTVSEALREAAMAAENRAIHIPNKKR